MSHLVCIEKICRWIICIFAPPYSRCVRTLIQQVVEQKGCRCWHCPKILCPLESARTTFWSLQLSWVVSYTPILQRQLINASQTKAIGVCHLQVKRGNFFSTIFSTTACLALSQFWDHGAWRVIAQGTVWTPVKHIWEKEKLHLNKDLIQETKNVLLLSCLQTLT